MASGAQVMTGGNDKCKKLSFKNSYLTENISHELQTIKFQFLSNSTFISKNNLISMNRLCIGSSTLQP